MSRTRAIRFPDREDRDIQEFLDKNPVFDFSLLARTAIRMFIENPQIDLTPVRKTQKRTKESSVVRN